MARISGRVLPNDKQIETALTYVYGIGRTTSQTILEQAQIDPDIRVKNLKDDQIQKIQQIINDEYQVEADQQRIVFGQIKHLKSIKSYRGYRHMIKLPCRGQRTRTNARTRRGKKVTVGGTQKKAPTKT